MKHYVKKLTELTTLEFYSIVKERTAVFVVEQNCPYQEVDTIDKNACHTFFKDESGEILAYTRIYHDEESVHFGRVLVNQQHRKEGLGRKTLYSNNVLFNVSFVESSNSFNNLSISSIAH